MKELKNILLFKDNISMYVKPVTAAWGCEFDETMYKDSDFFEIESKLIFLTKKYNFNMEIHPGSNYFTRCLAYQVGSYLIDPQLQLFKCPLHIGMTKERIGILNKDAQILIEKNNECIKYTNFSPFDSEECKNCRVLPLCNGKCPVKWEQLNYEENQACIPEKRTIVSKIKNYIITRYIEDYV